MNFEVDLLKISDLSIGEVCKPCDEGKVLENILEKVDVGKGKKTKCEHQKEKRNCRLCSPQSFCEHNKFTYYCIECTPTTFCIHKRRKAICKECVTENNIKGGQICEHNDIRTQCGLCKGGSTCIHKARKHSCEICSPENFCLHKKYQPRCSLCLGNSYCVHGKRKEICKHKDCIEKATSICSHGKRMNICFSCTKSEICIHNKIKSCCKKCYFDTVCVHEILRSECEFCRKVEFTKCEHDVYKKGCKKCNVDKLCSHGNWSDNCKQCFGKNICLHWKHIGNCIECGKVEICIHDIRKEICVPCKGSRVCSHDKLKHRCKICDGRALCKSEFCEITKNEKYDGYCVHCYIHLFPDKPLSMNYKNKEKTVVDFVKENFNEFDWISDKKIQDGCSRRRPDLLLDLGYQIIVIEVDENQHKNYDCSCENKRLMEISQDVDHRPLVFIRFNPDTYYEGEKMIESCWGINKKGICTIKQKKKKEWEERLNALKAMIEYWIDEENECEKTVEVIQLFYDC